jgi:hypothetical protein
MPDGKQILLSQYRGKVVTVCFILTTCSHCQMTIGELIKLQTEFGPKGYQVLASAIEQGAAFAVPNFVRAFQPNFPVGYNDPSTAVDFMQHPPMLVPLMPMLAFVDKQGMIRDQHNGDDKKFFNPLEPNLRAQITKLLGESSGGSKKGASKKTITNRQN